MVVRACNPSYSGGWGRRIAWTQEAEVAVSLDSATALQPSLGWDCLKFKKRSILIATFIDYVLSAWCLLCMYIISFNYLFFFFGFWTQSLLPRLEYSGMIIAHCSLNLLDSSDPPASASWIPGNTRCAPPCWEIFFFFFSRDQVSLCCP